MCNCGVPALRTTVKKEGPNKGREFFRCGLPRDCKFFLWADEKGAGGAVPPAPGGGTFFENRSSSSNASSGFKCYKCGDPGHGANACPGAAGAGNAPPAAAPAKKTRARPKKAAAAGAPKKPRGKKRATEPEEDGYE
jgi:hypothetical protein